MSTQDNVRALAAFLKEAKFEFNMIDIEIADCKTAGCIAGHAAALWPELVTGRNMSWVPTWAEADFDALLGLTVEQRNKLYYGFGKYTDQPDEIGLIELTRSGAIATLLRFADTGKVEWYKREQTQ